MTGSLKSTGAVICLISLIAAGGCASYATYPPVEMTGKLANPSYEPLPTLMTEAIRFAHDHYGAGEDDFAINLPVGVPHEIYSRVIRKLGMGHPLTDPGEQAYHVLELRIRGMEAEVDLVYPRSNSIYELVTITFSRRLVEGWVVLSSRLWRIRVDVPPSNYIPPEPTSLPEPASETQTPEVDLMDELDPPDDGGGG